MAVFLNFNKNRDAKDIIYKFPIRFKNYYEPFLYSGEVFFNLYRHGRIFEKAYLSSSNSDLIRTWIAVREEPERLQKLISVYCEKNSKQFFENMKKAVASPSAFIYVDRATGKGGKWRESQFIDLNREISKDVSDIEVCSRYIDRWCQSIRNIDWEMALTGANEGDVVWLEPPKLPCTSDGRIDYVTGGFNESNNVYLNNFCKQLANKGVKIFLVQSNTPATHRIYGLDRRKHLLPEGNLLYEY